MYIFLMACQAIENFPSKEINIYLKLLRKSSRKLKKNYTAHLKSRGSLLLQNSEALMRRVQI